MASDSRTVAIIATLDTKGLAVAYLRDRLDALGVGTVVLDTGILGEPVGIVPDVSHDELAARGGLTLAELQDSGSRGKAVERMRRFVSEWVEEAYAAGRISGGIAIGGVGSVMGAAALQRLPLGVPKIVVAPTASGHHEFGPYVGLKDVHVVHSVADILGPNPVLTTVLDNVAASMRGMLDYGHPLPEADPGRRFVAVTMLGNTTKAVEALSERLAEHDYEAVIFHSNGVGGPAMEELAQAGQFVGVIDFTTNEINDPLTGGIHNGGPDRLAVIGRLGLPYVLVPGCLDFSVFAADAVPERLRDRPWYDHNPEYTLVRASHAEKRQIGEIFAERVNEARGPVEVILNTGGLSIPAFPPVDGRPAGVFWDPEGDALTFAAIREGLRPEIPVVDSDLHINDPALGRFAADRFLALVATPATREASTPV